MSNSSGNGSLAKRFGKGAFVSAPMTVADGIELESDKSYTRYSILTPDEPEPCGSEVGSETIVNSDEDEDEDEGYVCKGFKDEDDEDNYYEDNTEVDQLVDELEEEENFGDEVVRDLPEHTPLRGERTTFHGAEIRFNGEHLHQGASFAHQNIPTFILSGHPFIRNCTIR